MWLCRSFGVIVTKLVDDGHPGAGRRRARARPSGRVPTGMVARGAVDRVAIVSRVVGESVGALTSIVPASCHNSAMDPVSVASDVPKNVLPNDAPACCQLRVISGARARAD